ncbi:MAG: glutamate--tRNA ligase [Candidatus Cloacimonadia bacterium]
MEKSIRVRFAPSPTGYLHVGGLRTALYNYLFARKMGGKFIIRIEDTDRTRYVEGAAKSLLKVIKDFNLLYDEGPDVGGDFGPYFQSERTEIYRGYASELIEKGYAYHCFCSAVTLEQMREEQRANKQQIRYDQRCRRLSQAEREEKLKSGTPYVIRSMIPEEGTIEMVDLVRGSVTFPWDMIDDQVLIKSDGFPTYHLANVVDDHLMEITDVIRGEEWLSSTPKHLFLYDAFGWTPPRFAHLPLLLNPDKSKLSKRQGDVAVEDFVAKGFLPEALTNFVALLGWHDATDREIFTLSELEEVFSLERINKAGSIFDIEKLKWMNGYYLRGLETKELAERAKGLFEEAKIDVSDEEKYLKVIDFVKERITLLPDIVPEGALFYCEQRFTDEEKEILNKESAQKILSFWLNELQSATQITDEKIEGLLKATTATLGYKGRDLYTPLRLSLYGKANGPNIPIIIDILGKEETIKRLTNVLNKNR